MIFRRKKPVFAEHIQTGVCSSEDNSIMYLVAGEGKKIVTILLDKNAIEELAEGISEAVPTMGIKSKKEDVMYR